MCHAEFCNTYALQHISAFNVEFSEKVSKYAVFQNMWNILKNFGKKKTQQNKKILLQKNLLQNQSY